MRNGVLVLSGPPCSGKSTAGRALAAQSNWSRSRRMHLEVDSLFDLLFPESDRNRDDRMFAYDAAHLLTRMRVERGDGVVLECTYARREQRCSLLRALADTQAPLWVIEFFVTPDEAVRRFRQRRQATDLDEQLVRERAEAFPYSDQALRVVSSAAGPQADARNIVKWLRQRPPPAHQDSWVQTGRGWE